MDRIYKIDKIGRSGEGRGMRTSGQCSVVGDQEQRRGRNEGRVIRSGRWSVARGLWRGRRDRFARSGRSVEKGEGS